MDIQIEKAAIIKRFEKVKDESLVKAFKNLLDYALSKDKIDEMLNASIDRGLAQSAKGETRPHKEVMAELREQYKI
jgi:predicted transcriptional regulator